MNVSGVVELVALAALVGGTYRLLGLGAALLVLGVVLLVISLALDDKPVKLPRRQRKPAAPKQNGPHPPLQLHEEALDSPASAYETAVRRITADRERTL